VGVFVLTIDGCKVKAPIIDQISNLDMIWSSARQRKYFWRCNDINDVDCKNLGNFII